MQYARLCIKTNISFRIAEDPEMVKFIGALTGERYKPPYRRSIPHLIKKIYDIEWSKFATGIRNKFGTYILDGWTSVTSENVLATIFATPLEWNLVQAHSLDSSTVDDILPKALGDINMLKSMQAEIVAFCCDNCNTMLSLRNEVLKYYPDMLVFGCTAHLADLALEKLTICCPGWSNLEGHIWEVQKAFRVPKVRRKLLQYKGKNPVLPAATII